MYVNFLSTYSDKKSCHTSTTLQTSIARSVSDSWASCYVSVCRHNKDTPLLSDICYASMHRYATLLRVKIKCDHQNGATKLKTLQSYMYVHVLGDIWLCVFCGKRKRKRTRTGTLCRPLFGGLCVDMWRLVYTNGHFCCFYCLLTCYAYDRTESLIEHAISVHKRHTLATYE